MEKLISIKRSSLIFNRTHLDEIDVLSMKGRIDAVTVENQEIFRSVSVTKKPLHDMFIIKTIKVSLS